ncbi:PIN domain-like protein [Paraphysoderma sedebokerense]|nr:PIN domain-like protein [Paraphysoderma sedebokerense]
MGITGLLPLLKSIQKPFHIKSLAGQTVAVDAYVWLHRGAFACAPELCLGKPTRKYIDYCMHRVRMLLHYKVKPFIVFDGGYLPMKAGTEKERRERREENRKKGIELWEKGHKSKAAEYFQKCVDITPSMAYEFIQALKAEGVQFVVAPYEADAQLAFLDKHDIVQAVITEDSDLLVFGCRKVIFKLDKYGEGVAISRSDFTKNKEPNFIGWSDDMFRYMAILSGCDYLSSIPGFGLKTAYRYLKRRGNVDRVLREARYDGYKIPQDYESKFREANLTFLHQRVFDVRTQQIVHLNPMPESEDNENWDFLGSYPF